MKVHLIGTGGIGVSALARYYKHMDNEVQGSDIVGSEIIDKLESEGITVFVGPHSEERIKEDMDLVVFSAAINEENTERKKAQELGIKTKKYSDALGEIAKKYFTICIAGTHGKSTTTAMLSFVLIEAGLDPTVIVGTKLKEFGDTNFHAGSSKPKAGFSKPLMLIEADEWNASFLSYEPDILAITNIEEEHLDFYKDLDHIIDTYRQFTRNIRDAGTLILNKNDSGSNLLLKEVQRGDIETKFFADEEQGTQEEVKKALKVPGKHNLENALTAMAVARTLSVPNDDILSGLSKYTGAWRRFDKKKLTIDGKEIILINDYAHHPTEIMATLEAVREGYSEKTVWTVFQPHQQQRTKNLMKKFAGVFDLTDKLILTDIYEVAGREKEEVVVTSQDLLVEIEQGWAKRGLPGKEISLVSDLKEISELIKKDTKDGDVVLIMGAGDIWNINKFI